MVTAAATILIALLALAVLMVALARVLPARRVRRRDAALGPSPWVHRPLREDPLDDRGVPILGGAAAMATGDRAWADPDRARPDRDHAQRHDAADDGWSRNDATSDGGTGAGSEPGGDSSGGGGGD